MYTLNKKKKINSWMDICLKYNLLRNHHVSYGNRTSPTSGVATRVGLP